MLLCLNCRNLQFDLIDCGIGYWLHCRYSISYSALIILIILLRFCWTFKTEKNEEHEKRIKGKDGKKKKKGKMLRH
jgi:hypothetical protein